MQFAARSQDSYVISRMVMTQSHGTGRRPFFESFHLHPPVFVCYVLLDLPSSMCLSLRRRVDCNYSNSDRMDPSTIHQRHLWMYAVDHHGVDIRPHGRMRLRMRHKIRMVEFSSRLGRVSPTVLASPPTFNSNKSRVSNPPHADTTNLYVLVCCEWALCRSLEGDCKR